MADEPTAIRPRKDDETGRGFADDQWHRLIPRDYVSVADDAGHTVCGLPVRISWGMRSGPLSQIPTADRCRTCWPTTKEQP